MYRSLVKPLMFRMGPERAHYFTTGWLTRIYKTPLLRSAFTKAFVGRVADHPVEAMGLRFKNAVGLAAGFDKDARWVSEMAMLGFGFVEIGTVTPRAQPGNPTPRLFRLPKDEALINRMGFNNDGADAAAQRLRRLDRTRLNGLVIGGNIGKNKDTPNENAVDDYVYCFNALYDVVDYFVVNVSSPNTPGLRALQEREPLQHLLRTLQQLNRTKPLYKPLLLKIAPDLTNEQLDEVIDIVLEEKLDGIIATNTTIDRNGLNTTHDELEKIGAGGLSGSPLRKRSTEIVTYIVKKAAGRFIVIGSGGVDSAEAAVEKIQAGARLVQVYTGLVYEGPNLVSESIRTIAKAARP